MVIDESVATEIDKWMRRQELVGREVDTTGGTKVGVIGFKLARIFVEGPIAKKQAVAREVVVDTGAEDGVMTVDLAQAEQHSLSLS